MAISALPPDPSSLPAFQAMKEAEMDECGPALFASRTVGVPFVGLIAGGLVIGELLRRLHGGAAIDLVSGSAASLADIEASVGATNLMRTAMSPPHRVAIRPERFNPTPTTRMLTNFLPSRDEQQIDRFDFKL